MDSSEKIARVRISLANIAPEIWRRVEVPLVLHLKGLHDVIQAVFGWQDYHLFEFRVGGKLYGIPAPDEDYGRKVLQARSGRLATLIAKGFNRFDYVYDFGDCWEHVVAIEAADDADPALLYPRFVDGARRGPPEDVGGYSGYERFLRSVRNRRDPDHRRLITWYGGPYDPDDIDRAGLDRRLAAVVQRRETGKAAFEKSRMHPAMRGAEGNRLRRSEPS
jgi:hypothetical protein